MVPQVLAKHTWLQGLIVPFRRKGAAFFASSRFQPNKDKQTKPNKRQEGPFSVSQFHLSQFLSFTFVSSSCALSSSVFHPVSFHQRGNHLPAVLQPEANGGSQIPRTAGRRPRLTPFGRQVSKLQTKERHLGILLKP